MMAAGQAASLGSKVLILEKMDRPARKLLITGKGRCNLTNTAPLSEFLDHFKAGGPFLRQAFHRFFSDDLVRFLDERGLSVVRERGGRVFPASGKASDVVAAFRSWLDRSGAVVQCASPVDRLHLETGRVTGVVSRGRRYGCDAVILAAGGSSYPGTGSTGDGFRMARESGHDIVRIRPALVPLETRGDTAARVQGLNLRNIRAKIFVNGKKRFEEFGELVFAEYGVTGPVVLTVSGGVVDLFDKKNEIVLSLDLKPALDASKLDSRLLRDLAKRGSEEMQSILRGVLPEEMIFVCLSQTGIPAERKGGYVTAKERKRLKHWLKNFQLEVTGHRPLEEAIVTAGGVNTREIDPRTMESRLIRGLYLAGEVIDYHGDTGGYNLQAAFSTGWLAGRRAAGDSS